MSKDVSKVKIRTKAVYVDIISRFMSKEETRYYLCGICIKRAPKGIYIVGTDGHRFGIFHDPEGTIEGKDVVIMPVSDELKAGCKKKNYFGGDNCFLYENGVAAVVQSPDILETMPMGPCHAFVEYVDMIDGTFPNFERIFPDAHNPGECLSFNGNYLKDFCFGPDGEDGHTATIHPGEDKVSPASVRNPHFSNFYGVLMPMRTDTKDAQPDFIKEMLKGIAKETKSK